MNKKGYLKNKKNQHFVPKSYLRRFTIEGEKSLIWTFDKQTLEFSKTPASINKLCTKDYYYYQQDGDGFEHTKLEDEISKVEKIANDIIVKIVNAVNYGKSSVNLSETERGYFAFYVALMLTRNPAFRDGINNIHGGVIRSIFNHVCRSGELPEPPDVLKKHIDEKGGIDKAIKIRLHPFVSLEPMRKLAINIGESILAKNWQFLVAPEKFEFITSDTPVAFGPAFEQVENIGPAHPDAMLTFPVSKKISLNIAGIIDERNMSIQDCPINITKSINMCIAFATNELILCSKKHKFLRNKAIKKSRQKVTTSMSNTGYEIIENPYKKP